MRLAHSPIGPAELPPHRLSCPASRDWKSRWSFHGAAASSAFGRPGTTFRSSHSMSAASSSAWRGSAWRGVTSRGRWRRMAGSCSSSMRKVFLATHVTRRFMNRTESFWPERPCRSLASPTLPLRAMATATQSLRADIPAYISSASTTPEPSSPTKSCKVRRHGLLPVPMWRWRTSRGARWWRGLLLTQRALMPQR